MTLDASSERASNERLHDRLFGAPTRVVLDKVLTLVSGGRPDVALHGLRATRVSYLLALRETHLIGEALGAAQVDEAVRTALEHALLQWAAADLAFMRHEELPDCMRPTGAGSLLLVRAPTYRSDIVIVGMLDALDLLVGSSDRRGLDVPIALVRARLATYRDAASMFSNAIAALLHEDPTIELPLERRWTAVVEGEREEDRETFLQGPLRGVYPTAEQARRFIFGGAHGR